MRFAIVGAGFLGRSLAVELASRGHDCLLVTRRSDVRPAPSIAIADADGAARLGPRDTVVYAGGVALPRLALTDLDSAIDAARADLRRAAGVAAATDAGLVLQISSGGAVYGAPGLDGPPPDEARVPFPDTPYGALKLFEEVYLRRVLPPTTSRTVLRCTNVYGPLQPAGRTQGIVPVAIRHAVAGTPMILFASPGCVRDYVLVDDVALAVEGLAGPGAGPLPPVINVGSGEGTSIERLLGVVADAVGRTVPLDVRTGPPADRRTVSVDLLERLVDWSPTPLEVGVRSVAAAIRAESAGGPAAATLLQ